MGLDMWLKASRYVGGWNHDSDEQKKFFASILQALGLKRELVDDSSPALTVEVNVVYWRKANAVHKWFVDNCQGGEDDCGTYDVSREQLQQLLEAAKQEIATKGQAGALTPTSGFFFGSTEKGEWYWQDMEHTVNSLEKLLAAPEFADGSEWHFMYHSSW